LFVLNPGRHLIGQTPQYVIVTRGKGTLPRDVDIAFPRQPPTSASVATSNSTTGTPSIRLNELWLQMPPLFEYTSLGFEGNLFRVVEILPGHDESIIQCSMRNTTIEDGEYFCLSYTWQPDNPFHGNRNQRKDCHCGRESVAVPTDGPLSQYYAASVDRCSLY
jgi:hypothetical protein